MAIRLPGLAADVFAVVFGVVLLAGCGGGGDDRVQVEVTVANPAVTRLISGVDAIGVGGAGLLSSSATYPDLQLRANRAGSTVQLRFSCTGCSLTVRAGAATAGANQYISVPFADLSEASNAAVTVTDNASGAVANYTLRAQPLDAAPYRIGINTNPQPGDLYLTPFDPQGYGAGFAYIVGTDGALKYYYRNPPGHLLLDFKKTVLPNSAVRYSFYDGAASGIRVMDQNFATLEVVQAQPFPDGNTYAVDFHDHAILGEGHYLIGVNATKTVTNIPSQPGVSRVVAGTGLQEIVNGAATFSWLSTDNPALYACSARGNDFAAANADYTHWTSLQVDGDGDLLAAFRNLDAVLKIRRSDGAVRWILGGSCDQFGVSAAQKFTSPHDARRAPDGRLTVFDVGAAGVNSRVVAFGLNEAGPSLASFTSYTTDSHSSYNLGSAQFFASGKALVGWGEFNGFDTDVSEYDLTTGAISFELTLLPSYRTNGYFSYSARKFQ